MNSNLPIIDHLDHRIRVVTSLLDVSQRTFGIADANLSQHLVELNNSRMALSRLSSSSSSAGEQEHLGEKVTPPTQPTQSQNLQETGCRNNST